MALLAYNITGSQVALVAGKPAPILPPSSAPPARGLATDVTRELQGLNLAEYTALEAQRPNTVVYQWTRDPEFSVGALSVLVAIGPHQPTAHNLTHITGGSDPINIAGTVATNQSATTGIANTNNATATNAASIVSGHEVFLAPEALGGVKATIGETVAAVSPSAQPTHPGRLNVTFPAGWSGGNIQITGLGADCQPVSETVTAIAGATVGTQNAFLLIDTPNGITNLAPAMSGIDSVTIESSNDLAVSLPRTSEYTSLVFHKLVVDGVEEAFAGSSPTFRRFLPTSVKDGSKNFEVWYTAAYTPTQVAHFHTVTDGGHNHTQNNHTHTTSQ